MGYGQFDGCECCGVPVVDWVSYDDHDFLSNRVRAVEGDDPILIWENTTEWDDLAGIAYAPGFAEGGLMWDNVTSGTDGLYNFDIEDGTKGSLLVSFGISNVELSSIFHEAGNYCCFHDGNVGGPFFHGMRATNSVGSVVSYTQSFTFGTYNGTNGMIRRPSNGHIWRTRDSGGMLIYDHENSTRLDLSGTAVTSTSIAGLTSIDGETLWCLGFADDGVGGRDIELFRITASTGSASVMASYNTTRVSDPSPAGMNLVGGIPYWAVTGDQRVWAFNGSLQLVLDAAWTGPGVILAGGGFTGGFFAPIF